jgi:glycerol-3-phosphate O-acyltransferase
LIETLTTAFGKQIKTVMAITKAATVITEDNVYQEGDNRIQAILDEMIESLLLPGSGLDGLENLEELLAKAESGKSCLLLVEHYSNFDLSIVSYLSKKAGGRGEDISNAIIAIAGMKLNEDNPVVAAFASAYTKIVIFPSRSLQNLDPEKDKAELARSNAINRAAMRTLIRQKYKGKLILVFPAGTRYRPGEPETKKGVREIDTYIRSFDYMCFVALNGEILHVQKTDMMNDSISKDIMRVTVSPVIECAAFRDKIRETEEEENKKQAVVDAVMSELEKLHNSAEEKRLKLLNTKEA